MASSGRWKLSVSITDQTGLSVLIALHYLEILIYRSTPFTHVATTRQAPRDGRSRVVGLGVRLPQRLLGRSTSQRQSAYPRSRRGPGAMGGPGHLPGALPAEFLDRQRVLTGRGHGGQKAGVGVGGYSRWGSGRSRRGRVPHERSGSVSVGVGRCEGSDGGSGGIFSSPCSDAMTGVCHPLPGTPTQLVRSTGL